MKRGIIKELQKWATSAHFLPLLLRGARQVGKTFAVEDFARTHFEHLLTINFELEPEYSACFESLKPLEIINALQGLSGQTIAPGKTLLFFDEIQNCPRAIMALRYFKEQLPNLHVIGAGSLLEFALAQENFSMPVGRVQFIYLKPLSFQEFLLARGFDNLLEALKTCTLAKPLPLVLHQRLLKLVREYFVIGGMPAAVQTYLDSHNFMQTQRIQTVILSTYRHDFGKYAKLSQHQYLQKIFNQAPKIIGQHLKFSKIDPDSRARDLKQAIEHLTQAGIVLPIMATTASGLPLAALANEKKLKLLFLDIGLVTRNMGIAVNDILGETIQLINQGMLAEQFVGQELLAYQDYYDEAKLFFWARENKSSLAEVDYVMSIASTIIPIEVKAGSVGRLKSLQIMLAEKSLPLGIRISQLPLQREQHILSLPFYLIGELQRIIKEAEYQ